MRYLHARAAFDASHPFRCAQQCAEALARRGHAERITVRAFAPTASAADVLGRAIDAEPVTVARLLAAPPAMSGGAREAWIVDEASMLSARDAER